MKTLFYVLLCLLTFDAMSRGEGNSSGGPRFIFVMEKFLITSEQLGDGGLIGGGGFFKKI